MDISRNLLSSGRGGGGVADASTVSAANISVARRVNFTQNPAEQKAGANAVGRSSLQQPQATTSLSRQGSQAGTSTPPQTSHASGSLKGPPPSHRPSQNIKNRAVAEFQQKTNGSLSFSRVEAAGGAQGSVGSEPDYWSYGPPMTSAANRIFSLSSRQDVQSVVPDTPGQNGRPGSGRTSSIERLVGARSSAAERTQETPLGTAALRQALDAIKEASDVEAYEMGDVTDWREPQQKLDLQEANGDMAGAIWRKRIARTSTHYPICARTARERCAYTTSDDWAIFALHNQYVRPLRDREWVPGEPCIIRKDSFELPPGACRYSESTCGLPATAFNSFVFPNPPRQFLMPPRGTAGVIEFGPSSACLRAGRAGNGGRHRSPHLTQQQLLDLERMLWFDPEPRLERPFRLYADSKGCLKGHIHDIGHIMRSGW